MHTGINQKGNLKKNLKQNWKYKVPKFMEYRKNSAIQRAKFTVINAYI